MYVYFFQSIEEDWLPEYMSYDEIKLSAFLQVLKLTLLLMQRAFLWIWTLFGFNVCEM